MLSYLRRRFLGTRTKGRSARPCHCRLTLETLEQRITPYCLSGHTWASPNVSVSFMPDGTLISGSYPSNVFAVYNAAFPQATWQHEMARALQVWANVSNLNFHFVSDDGSPQSVLGLPQADPRFGDIRIGGYNMGTGILGLGSYPDPNWPSGGDVELNTNGAFPIGSVPDLASVMMHEGGHGIGFCHSLANPAVMEGGLWGTYPGPYADDIAGVQAMYGARQPDAYDAKASNDTLASATPLTISSGAVTVNADLTTMSDVDFYTVTAPSNSDGTLTVSVDASTISLLDPKVSVYNSAGTLLGTASALTYQGTATLNLTGLVAGQTYYLEASGATTDAFGMGAYKLGAQFGPVPLPSLSINNVSLNEGNSGTTAFTFNVTLSTASLNPVTVQYATADGTATIANNDFQAASGTLTFAPGQTQQTVKVVVNGDTVFEPNETFSVNLSSPTKAVLGTSQGTGTIQNDDIGPDQYEVDNSMATAHGFGKMSGLNLSSLTLHTTTDLDYYGFVASSKGTYSVSATPTQGTGTLAVSVYNASGTQLATGQLSAGTVTVSASLSSGATYYIKGWSPTSSILMYNLTMGQSSNGGGKHLVLEGFMNPDHVQPDVFYQNAADDRDNPGYVPHKPAANSSPATGGSVGVALPAAADAFQNGAGSQRTLLGAQLNLWAQATPILAAARPVPAVVPVDPATGSASVVAPAMRPLVTGGQPQELSGGGDDSVPDDAFWTEFAEASAGDE